MKPAYGIFILVFLLSFSKGYAQKENNSVAEKKITIQIEDRTIAAILDSISAKAHVFFSYDPLLVEADKRTNLSVADKTIPETLDILFDSKFKYQILGEQIIITAPETERNEKAEDKQNEKNRGMIIFRGRVADHDEKVVLPYTNISIQKSNIGTISNTDGDFDLKIPEIHQHDTILISHLGYRPYRQPIDEIRDINYSISLQPTSVQLKEIVIKIVNVQDIVNKILSKIPLNYPRDPEIMTAFYREVLKQDSKYIDVAEAVMDIRKAPYGNTYISDKVKFVKGRKNINVKAFQFVDFKIQGGPYNITKLDVIKTPDSFLDPEFRENYKYTLDEIVELDSRDTYVIRFKPKEKIEEPCYQGKLFVDMASLALVQADFSLSRSGLKFAHEWLIKKKPKDFYVRPLNADYKVSYRRSDNVWHLSSAHASLNFKVKSKQDKVNSTFHSISDLLITDFKADDGTHFKKDELFNPKDIFTETITSYDEDFWDNYNIIKPSEDLQNALHDYYLQNDSLFKINEKEEKIINKN